MDKNNILTVSFLKQYKGKNEDLFTAQGKFDFDTVEDDYRGENRNGSHLHNFIFDVALREKCMVR